MGADVAAEALGAVVAQNEPELQRPKPAAEGDLPVSVIEDLSRFGGAVPEVLRRHRQRADERAPVRDPEAVAVEVREHPLVGVEAVGIGQLDAFLEVAELGTEEGGS